MKASFTIITECINQFGTPGRIRTDTVTILSRTPLPIGLQEQKIFVSHLLTYRLYTIFIDISTKIFTQIKKNWYSWWDLNPH